MFHPSRCDLSQCGAELCIESAHCAVWTLSGMLLICLMTSKCCDPWKQKACHGGERAKPTQGEWAFHHPSWLKCDHSRHES